MGYINNPQEGETYNVENNHIHGARDILLIFYDNPDTKSSSSFSSPGPASVSP